MILVFGGKSTVAQLMRAAGGAWTWTTGQGGAAPTPPPPPPPSAGGGAPFGDFDLPTSYLLLQRKKKRKDESEANATDRQIAEMFKARK